MKPITPRPPSASSGLKRARSTVPQPASERPTQMLRTAVGPPSLSRPPTRPDAHSPSLPYPAGAEPGNQKLEPLGVASLASQEWTQDEADDLLAMFSGAEEVALRLAAGADEEARPDAQIEALRALHYSAEQIESIKPGARSALVQHHQALAGHGFAHEEFGKVSTRFKSRASLAQRYPRVRQLLPTLTPNDVGKIAQRRSGQFALDTLLLVAADLKDAPPFLTDQQLAKIAYHGERPALQMLHRLFQAPSPALLSLNAEQIVSIASSLGGKQALEAVHRLLPELCTGDHALNQDQVIAIASKGGGKQALEAVHKLLPTLCAGDHALTKDEVVAIASKIGGKQALEAMQQLLPGLCTGDHPLSKDQVIVIANKDGGKQALDAVQKLLPDLCAGAYALARDEVATIASKKGGKQLLEAVHRLLPTLCADDYALTKDDVVAIANNSGGKQALEAVHRLLPDLCSGAHALSKDEVVAIASRRGGGRALDDLMKTQIEQTRASP